MKRVFNPCFLLLHLDFSGRSNLDQSNSPGKLRNPFLQLLLVIVAGGGLDLRADLLDAGFDVAADACTVDDRRVFLADRLAWPSSVSVAFSSVRPTSSAITCPPVRMAMSSSIALRRSPKPGALTAQVLSMPRMLLTYAADVVDHQGGKRFAIDILGDDQQRSARLGDLLENG